MKGVILLVLVGFGANRVVIEQGWSLIRDIGYGPVALGIRQQSDALVGDPVTDLKRSTAEVIRNGR
jgi:hypothetical protein